MQRSNSPARRLLFVALALAAALVVPACGGADKRVGEEQKQAIRQNADSADRDLDRESSKAEQ